MSHLLTVVTEGELVLGRGVDQHVPYEVDPAQSEAGCQRGLPVGEGARGDLPGELLAVEELPEVGKVVVLDEVVEDVVTGLVTDGQVQHLVICRFGNIVELNIKMALNPNMPLTFLLTNTL